MKHNLRLLADEMKAATDELDQTEPEDLSPADVDALEDLRHYAYALKFAVEATVELMEAIEKKKKVEAARKNRTARKGGAR